jgi:hypothetical protein
MERPLLEPGIELCNRQIAVVEENLSGLVVTGEKYLSDYATENECFDRTKELVDKIIMHLNAKVTKPKNTNGNGRPLPKQIVKYCARDNLMKKSDAILEETLRVVKVSRSKRRYL